VLGIALVVAVLLVVAIAAAQFVLPRIAEQRLAGHLRSAGEVQRVTVRARPALKLLADRADRVEVRMGDAHAGGGDLGDMLVLTEGTDELDARVETVRLGPLVLTDLRMAKRGAELAGRAEMTESAISAALPPTTGLRPVASGGGELVLSASAGLLGVGASIRARLFARDGALVIAPEIPFGRLASLTVFRDPRIEVTGVGAQETPQGYALTATARLSD
jgi:hypothetical protein